MKYLVLALSALGSMPAAAQFITNNGVPVKTSALVTTNGDWENTAETVLINDGIIRTSNSFVNHGTLGGSGTGKFILDFATDLNFQPGNGAQLRVLVKRGLGNALLTGSIHVKDSMLLYTGLLQMITSTDTVVLDAGAFLAADTGSHITGGLVARAGKADLVFPLGVDGHYLPLKLYQVDAQRVTVALTTAPETHSAGPGVNALIDFPYAWRVVGAAPADTAGYVEVDYPNTLPTDENLIVAREIPGQQYAGMGARSIETSALRTTVKSYSRRLNGLFTVASGFPSDFETDSLALVALYHSTGGAEWTDHTNWLTGPVETWFGITLSGQNVTAIALASNNLTGSIPQALVDIASLQEVDVSVNELSGLPDFSPNAEITLLDVSDNSLDFAALEPNAEIAGLSYLVQDEIGVEMDTLITVGSPFRFEVNAGGSGSLYTWFRNGEKVADSVGATFDLPAISRQNMGSYTADIRNPKLPGLVLTSKIQKASAYANVTGILYADSAVTAEQGEMTLYRIQSGGFEPVASAETDADGTWQFEKVILGDYQLRGFADTVLHPGALPTYYVSTLSWETADSLSVEDNINNLEIISQQKPATLTGEGSITGSLQEVDPGGRVKENRPIAGVGVMVYSIAMEGDEEIATLAGFTFTNEQGEFTVTNLTTGDYRLAFQYPGVPMDETSFTTFSIGTEKESHVVVEASVKEGKISVVELAITGIYQPEDYSLEAYPNPASHLLLLRFPSEAKGRTINLSDGAGRKLTSMSAVEKEVALDLRTFRQGIYLLQIHENGISVKTLKVMVK